MRLVGNLEGKQRDISFIMSELYRLDLRERCFHDEIDSFHAPSECHHLVGQAFDEAKAKIFSDHHWTPEELFMELKRRKISQKWLFFHGPVF